MNSPSVPVSRPLPGSLSIAARRAAYRRRLAVLLAVRRAERGRDTAEGGRPTAEGSRPTAGRPRSERAFMPEALRPRPLV